MNNIIEEQGYDTENDHFIPNDTKRNSTSYINLKNESNSKQRFSETNHSNLIIPEGMFRRSYNTTNSEGVRNSTNP